MIIAIIVIITKQDFTNATQKPMSSSVVYGMVGIIDQEYATDYVDARKPD